jgi:hypothetical protein
MINEKTNLCQSVLSLIKTTKKQKEREREGDREEEDVIFYARRAAGARPIPSPSGHFAN